MKNHRNSPSSDINSLIKSVSALQHSKIKLTKFVGTTHSLNEKIMILEWYIKSKTSTCICILNMHLCSLLSLLFSQDDAISHDYLTKNLQLMQTS